MKKFNRERVTVFLLSRYPGHLAVSDELAKDCQRGLTASSAGAMLMLDGLKWRKMHRKEENENVE